MRGTGAQRQFWGTGITEMKILILGNRGTEQFISGEQDYPVNVNVRLSC